MYSACNCFQTFHNCFNLAPITNLFFFNCSVIHFNQQTVTFTLYNVVEGKELCISWLPLHKMYAWNTDLWENTALQQGFYFFSSFLWKRHDPLFLFHMMKGCFVPQDWKRLVLWFYRSHKILQIDKMGDQKSSFKLSAQMSLKKLLNQ